MKLQIIRPFYFLFRNDSEMKGRYQMIVATDLTHATEKMNELYGPIWTAGYSSKEWSMQRALVRRERLKPLAPAVAIRKKQVASVVG